MKKRAGSTPKNECLYICMKATQHRNLYATKSSSNKHAIMLNEFFEYLNVNCVEPRFPTSLWNNYNRIRYTLDH